MPSANAPGQQLRSPPATMHEFCANLMGATAPSDFERIHVTFFKDDPHSRTAPSSRWHGLRLSAILPTSIPNPGFNWYFSIAMLKAGTKGRSDRHVEQARILAVDDVGTKVDPQLVHRSLTARGILPAAVIETSAGNFTALYRLTEQGLPLGEVAMLHARMKELGLGDRATHDLSRYMRGPFGVNTKQGKSFRVRLAYWQPEHEAGYRTWCRVLWDQSAEGPPEIPGGVRPPPTVWQDRRASMKDPLVHLALEIGLDPSVSARPGVIEAICPFWEEHTDGAKDGFAFVNRGRMKCHHGHCIDRRSRDFEERMVQIYEDGIRLGLSSGSLSRLPSGRIVDAITGKTVHATAKQFMTAVQFEQSDATESYRKALGNG